MKIVYFGSPDFSVAPLEMLIKKGYNVIAVVTNKDKPVGRKQIMTETAVKTFAKKNNIKVLEYKSVRKEGVNDLKALNPDLMITCAFGQILSQEILDIPKLMTLNIHASLLPLYRGSAPIQWAIINGEEQTGITIMKTDAGIDTGDIMFSVTTKIEENETAGELFARLSKIGAEAIVTALEKVKTGNYYFTKQDESKATYVKMLDKSYAEIDFNKNSDEICNLIRGLNPWPIAKTYYNNEELKIYSAVKGMGSGEVGEILRADKELEIATKDSSIIIKEIQKTGGKRLFTKDFLNGAKMKVGDKLGNKC